MRMRTLAKVKIDQVLIRDAHLFGLLLEIVNNINA